MAIGLGLVLEGMPLRLHAGPARSFHAASPQLWSVGDSSTLRLWPSARTRYYAVRCSANIRAAERSGRTG
ncbi:MAG: hypothetical protein AMK73_09225 [Planctomycetes bacterium SM23_32]|nr:MAG: hypothetical protein AMK73_09225 [Planctomycetes bacterium SM23_32]